MALIKTQGHMVIKSVKQNRATRKMKRTKMKMKTNVRIEMMTESYWRT